jgi:hypothetical protein
MLTVSAEAFDRKAAESDRPSNEKRQTITKFDETAERLVGPVWTMRHGFLLRCEAPMHALAIQSPPRWEAGKN